MPRPNWTNDPDNYRHESIALDTDYPINGGPVPSGFRVTFPGNVSVRELDGINYAYQNLMPGESVFRPFKRINTIGTTVSNPAENITVLF